MDASATIDIDRIVRARAGKKARFIPRFATRWLERFIHQDFINSYLQEGRTGVDFCEGTIEKLGVTLQVEGRENLPHDGRPATFVSNHPLGAIDGVALGGIIGRAYDSHVKYLVNDLLMNLKGLAPLCVPINKLGGQSRNLPQQINAAFGSENHIIMFPAGICSRLIDGEIRDLPWGKTFVQRSVQTRRDVIPIHFIGENSPRFYRIARWCKRLGIKFNIAMLFLPDEMYRSRGRHYTVRIGKPIPYQQFDNSRTPTQWAQWVREQVYKL
ncbi:MAG: glycerol acyltransferase [Bacteroidales bacterium]|nr:glycerol acyltransferase [Bacteroidales bacterium]